MRFEMQAFAGSGVLAGALHGQKVFARIVAATDTKSDPEIIFLDFSGVAVATTSFLRESVVGYRNYARSHWSNVYPIVANLGPAVREELEQFLVQQGDALAVCKLNRSSEPSDVHVLGRLDGKQDLALRAVVQAGEVDAPTLARTHKDPPSPTAWNNRLAALASKGLIIESSTGRGKRYRPVLERLRYGT